jgi:hypothetical protein
VIRPEKTEEFIRELGKILPQVLEDFPENFSQEMNRLVTVKEAEKYVPVVEQILRESFAEFTRLYGSSNRVVYGEWEKINLLAIKRKQALVLEKARTQTLDEYEETVLGGTGLVMNRCEQLYVQALEIQATESGRKNFI